MLVLDASAHCESPNIHVDHFFEAHTFINEEIRCHHSDEDVARGYNVPPVPRKRITRATALLLHRLRANCAYTKKTLHLIGKQIIHFAMSAGTWRMCVKYLSLVPSMWLKRNYFETPFVLLADRRQVYLVLFFRRARQRQLALC